MSDQMITKVLPFEVKEIDRRVLEFIGSTEDKDRQGDIIMAAGWNLKHYLKNPVFLWSHQYNEPPVGKAIKVWVEDGKLKFHIKFAEKEEYEFADTIYKLYKGGYLRASSVGFLPLKSEPIEEVKDDEMIIGQPTRYLKQELLELSGCPVPANPNALAEAKAKGLIKDEESFLFKGDTEKPYPNEHSCRIKDPGGYDRFARKNCEQKHEGKCIDVIYGIKEGKTELQALRYKKDIWDEGAARNHCKSREGTFEAASGEEEGANYLQVDQESCKMFNQETIADEFDFLGAAIENAGLNDENMERAWELVRTVTDYGETRDPGSDIPVDIAEKVGAVLNKINRERLEKIKTLAQEVLDSAEKPEPPEEPEKEIDVAKEVGDAVREVFNKARGKIPQRR